MLVPSRLRDAREAPDRADKLWYFKSAPLFRSAGAPLLAQLAAASTMRRVAPGRRVYAAGDAAATVYLLKEGQVRLLRSGPEGEETTIALLGPLDLFGERALVAEEQREETAEAVGPCLVCDIPRAELLAILERCPPLRIAVFRLFVLRTAQLECRLADLVFKGAEARLCTVLLDLASERGRPGPAGSVEVPLAVATRDLGRLAGLGRQTASTLFNGLVREGLVERRISGFRLLDPEALRRRADR